MKVKLNLNVLPRIRNMFAGLKNALGDFFSALGRKIVAVLCLRGIARFFQSAVRGVLDFFGNIIDRTKSFFSGCWSLLCRGAGAVRDFLGNLGSHIKAIPGHLFRLLRAALAWRPPQRTWTLLIALVTMGAGGFLVVGPAKELATGKSFQWETLVTICWLLTALGMLLGGMGVFLRTPTFRRYFAAAFVCSLPVAGAFGYQTLRLAQKLRTAEGADREVLTRWVSGGVQLCAVFLGVAALLVFLLRTRLLRSMVCHEGAGTMGSGAVGAVQGGAVAYLVWHVFRWLGFVNDIGWFVEAVYAVPVEYFVGAGAFLGTVINGYFGFRRHVEPAEPVPGGATGLAIGSGAGYLAWMLCQWLAATQDIAWCATVIASTRMEYFIGGGALLFCGIAVYRGLRAHRSPMAFKRSAPPVSGGTRPAMSGGTQPAFGGGTRSAFGSGTGTQSAGTQSAGTQSAGTQSAGTQSAGTQSAGTQSSGTQSAGTQSAGTRSASTVAAMDDLFD